MCQKGWCDRARKIKDSVPMAFRLRSDLAKKIDDHNEKTGLPKTVIVKKALEKYFADLEDEDHE